MAVRTFALVLAVALGLPPAGAAASAVDPAGTELFHGKVWPLLQRACMTCHGEDDPENGLRVDSREALLKGGKSGPAAVPGRPGDSLLVQVVRWNHGDMRMPPKRKLPDPVDISDEAMDSFTVPKFLTKDQLKVLV